MITTNELNNFKSKEYQDFYDKSVDPDTFLKFWYEESKELFWYKAPTEDNMITMEKPPFYKWYPNSTTNICYNCIDRHVKNNLGSNLCLIHESAYSDKTITYTFKEALEHVGKLAWVLKNKFGVKRGDRVIIYMPMVLEGILSMLACARIGAIHSVVFGGFAAEELENRITSSKPVLLITASVGIEPRKQIPYYPIIKEALNGRQINVLMLQREEFYIEKNVIENITFDYNKELQLAKEIEPCVEMDSNEVLYILYTSGTTGSPKGITRDIGGTCVALNFSGKYIMDLNPGDVVGHSYIVYAPLIRGAASLIFEGKPVGTPDCGVLWKLCDKWNVKSFYTSPTALRAIKKEDHDCKVFKSYKLEKLTGVHMAGERCDPATILWLQKGLPSHVLINDSWWQTETGHHISGNNLKIYKFPVVPGSATRPLPGFNVQIIDEDTDELITEPGVMGKVVIKLPLPPSFMVTLWESDKAFVDKYISEDHKYYISGDAGFFDKEGYLHIMTRIDDIIKVAAHRLSTGRIEEVINYHKDVAESACVGLLDELKGEVPFAFIVTKKEITTDEGYNKVIKDISDLIVKDIGAISRISGAIVVNRLPKTRSGKVLRRILRKILNQEPYKIPPTIDDASILDEIKELLIKAKIIK